MTFLRPGVVAALALTMLPLVACSSEISDAPAGATLVVDRKSPSCSDTPKLPVGPYCTIGAAAQRVRAGQSVVVAGGTYNEEVSLAASGRADAPIIISALPDAVVTVTGKRNGFRLQSKSHVIVQGFTIVDTRSSGIFVTASDHVTFAGNVVSGAGTEESVGEAAHGITIATSRALRIVGNHVQYNRSGGLFLDGASSGNTVDANRADANGSPDLRASAGFDIRGDGNFVVNNFARSNGDSGIQFHSGGTGNLAANNVLVGNGDHGVDIVDSPSQRVVGNTVVGNRTSGINVEGVSPGVIIANNIASDNAVGEFQIAGNIRVTDPSTTDTFANNNVVWSSGGDPLYVWASKGYSNLDAVRAEFGQEQDGVNADPRFVDAPRGNFHLSGDSPAVDVASPIVVGHQEQDAEGRIREGGGPDAGALERGEGPAPPPLVLTIPGVPGATLQWQDAPSFPRRVTGYEVVVDDQVVATVPGSSSSAPLPPRTRSVGLNAGVRSLAGEVTSAVRGSSSFSGAPPSGA